MQRIWITDPITAIKSKQITNDNDYRDEHPMWSRNGDFIMFCRMDRRNQGTLWLMKADGSEPTQVSGVLRLKVGWFGYYGYIDWQSTFDWYQPPMQAQRLADFSGIRVSAE